ILVGKRGHRSKKSFYPEPEKWMPEVCVWDLLNDLPKIQAGSGTVTPQQAAKKPSEWLEKSGVYSNFPITWHQARPHSKQDLEIYRYAVNLWDSEKRRLHYDDLPEYLKSHKGRNSFVDRFKVVAGDIQASHTVVAHISKDGHHYIHPDIEQNRSLTPREAARIQSFPDDYFFENVSGKPARTSAFKQIGNAVPVLLAQKIAEQLLRNW
ncbi:DNA cytosine methyltransferase, partial [Acinetobacter baumannii]|nr:DNA cytosine methyltransferase [Acinetobacter baumannii]